MSTIARGLFTTTMTNRIWEIPDGDFEIAIENIGQVNAKIKGNIIFDGIESSFVPISKGEGLALSRKDYSKVTIDTTGGAVLKIIII